MRRGMITGLVALAGAALLLPSTAIAESRGAAATPTPTTPRIYNVTVTAQTKTTWIDGGCGQDCVRYDGTVKRTESYRGVRIRFYEFREIVQLDGNQAGTFTTQWNHASEPPPCRESPTQTGKASINVYGRYGVGTNRLPPLMTLGVGPAGPPRGPAVTCPDQMNPVPVVGRLGTSLVGGTLTDSTVTLNGFKVGRRANGVPGSPLDEIRRGVRFVITLSGTTKDLASTKEELALKKQATYTEGTVRIVFTPVARTPRRAPSSYTARKGGAATDAAGTECATTYPAWWSTKRRACFLVTASARWQLTKTWAQDSGGAECRGAETTSMSWKSKPRVFWVGDTFPAGYTSASRARTGNFLQGPLDATVSVQASGGAFEYRCTPLLTKDCGTRRVTFADPTPAYAVMVQRPVTLLMSVVARSTPPSPFSSCGLLGTVELAPSPAFGGWVFEQRQWSPGISGRLDDLVEKRLLSVPVGATISFRASGRPVDSETYQAITGYLTGAVTFKRVR